MLCTGQVTLEQSCNVVHGSILRIGWLAGEVLEAMPYATAVIRESLRFKPSVGGVMRWTKEDVQVGGYNIPKVRRSANFCCALLVQFDSACYHSPVDLLQHVVWSMQSAVTERPNRILPCQPPWQSPLLHGGSNTLLGTPHRPSGRSASRHQST